MLILHLVNAHTSNAILLVKYQFFQISSANTDTAGYNHIKNGLEYCMNNLLRISREEIDNEFKKLVELEIRDVEKNKFISKCSKGHPFNVYCATFRKFQNKLKDYFEDACKLLQPQLYTVYLGNSLESFKNKFNIQYLDDTGKLIQTQSCTLYYVSWYF